MRTSRAVLVGLASAVGGLAVGYRLFVRNRCLTWGATAEEAGKGMPGDGLLSEPDLVTTRAITISATPEQIWPWLVQMGPGRGGAYTYDWVENLLGLDMHSASEVLPEFQDLAIDDILPMGKTGPRMRVAILSRPYAFALASTDHHWVWAFELYESDGGTRLLSRNRIKLPNHGVLQRFFYMFVMESGSLIMERKMLLGIKERAERARPLPAAPTDERHDHADLHAGRNWPTRTLGV
ncbi:SRPBCC family protein [Nocardia sp. CDC160]|uniref:SRPBCC family protein n=1 Tax=Nocardia sp. CDC160 TaxID=3112166 RepID=UPI002DB8D1AD|nr:SRPBCC family protein [Nocardia sp. CDC160]MEC3918710.1 SRPBCC family protein [Nocardia sp. CDC160]